MSEAILSQLVQDGQLAMRVGRTASAVGGRGLFATAKLPRGQRIGPILPVLCEGKPETLVLKHRPTAKANCATSLASKSASRCEICFASLQRKDSCSLCSRNAPTFDFAKQLEKALAWRRANLGSLSSRFGQLAENAVLRATLEEHCFGAANTLHLVFNLVTPAVGSATVEAEWQPLWDKANERLATTLRQANVPFRTLAIEQTKEQLFFQTLGALHLNAVGGPETSSLYPALSFANHCCTPSVRVQFDGGQAFLFPDQDLEAGDEITIHYAETANIKTWTQLQHFLEFNYGFKCNVGCKCGKLAADGK